jgi:hypothetical protein
LSDAAILSRHLPMPNGVSPLAALSAAAARAISTAWSFAHHFGTSAQL